MSKVFVKGWHEESFYKIRQVGTAGEALALIYSFLDKKFQCVTLHGQSSNWVLVKVGIPQRSIPGPLFFLVYINDLLEKITSTVKLFAHDTSFFLL